MSLPTPALRTDRLVLRPVRPDDADDLRALHSDREVLRFWDAPPWPEPARAERFVTASAAMAREGNGARLVVGRTADSAFLGWCSLTRWDAEHGTAALTYVLARSAWGAGHATEAVSALLGWAFDTLPLRRVQAEADTRSAASARVLEKLGFRHEGTLREDCVVEGVVSSTSVHGLLRREWDSR